MHCALWCVSKLCSYKFLDLWPMDYNRLLQYWCQQCAVNSTLCQTKHVTELTSVVFYCKNPRLCAFAWKRVIDNVLWHFLNFEFLSLYVMVADKVLVEPLSFSLYTKPPKQHYYSLCGVAYSLLNWKTNQLEICFQVKLLWPLNITKVTETSTKVKSEVWTDLT